MRNLGRIAGILIFLVFFAGGLWAGGKTQNSDTLVMLVQGNSNAEAYKQIAANYTKLHPGFVFDSTAIDGVTDFNTALTAKIAANDMPDIVDLQWDTNITKYAQNGYLMALDDLGLDSKLVNVKKKINVINGKTYAYQSEKYLYGRSYWLSYSITFGNGKSRGAQDRNSNKIQNRIE